MRTIAVCLFTFFAMAALAPREAHAVAGLMVRCDQEGAPVYLNGKLKGQCPARLTMKAGNYKLTIKKELEDESYYSYETQVSLVDGDIKKVDATLAHIYTEEYYYRTAAKNRAVSDWDNYLSKYPQGKYSNEVNAILEKHFLGRASGSGAVGDYREYLRRYPNGGHAVEAKQTIERIEREAREKAEREARERKEREARVAKERQERAQRALDEIKQAMVVVKGGCYQMGCGGGWLEKKCYTGDTFKHEVCVDDFMIGKYEVTEGQWTALMNYNPRDFKSSGERYPIAHITRADAEDFIKKLNQLAGGNKYRLPTEAEWEYAARKGGMKERFEQSDELDSVAWYNGNARGRFHPVGQKKPDLLGLYDMAGNVEELVQDKYDKDYYKSLLQKYL